MRNEKCSILLHACASKLEARGGLYALKSDTNMK